MAARARLSAPRQVPVEWHFHKVKSTSLPASMIFGKDRRMEAESFLASGFATRQAINAKPSGWTPLVDIAKTWQPSRLKGIQVSSDFGTPFLAATQVYDLRPSPRKWLSLEKTDDYAQRFVKEGTILLTCSGTVGRATLARAVLNDVIISHDLLRIEPHSQDNWGWLYAYLRAPSIIALMQAAHYGHVIKHLEVSHMDDVPVVSVGSKIRQKFSIEATRIISNRNHADKLAQQAEAELSKAFGIEEVPQQTIPGVSVASSEIFGGRRRLEGAYHSPAARALLTTLKDRADRLDTLSDLVEKVWWMTRFSRNFGEDGVPYMSADDLFAVSQIGGKRVFTDPVPNYRDFFVKQGWLLMACSGQVYGLNGSVTLATEHDENFFFSHDLIRIAPKPEAIRSGYLYAYLGHPDIGQQLVKRTAYGSSVPHIDPGDVEDLEVARLPERLENKIADLAEEASRLRAEASSIERDIAESAEEIISDFLLHGTASKASKR